MKFTVKGITFSKEELETIKIDDLKVNSISYAHLYIFVKEKPYLMLRAGDLITTQFIEKYKNKGLASFYAKSIVNKETFQKFKERLLKVKSLPKRKDKLKNVQYLINDFSFAYWQESPESYLSFAMACYDTFYHLPSDCILELQAKSQILYARALIISSLSVMTAVMDKFYDEKFLRDIYNTAFIMDIGLVQNGDFNYLLAKACEYERNHPGTGLSWLKSHPKCTYEADVFYQHPQSSYRMALKFEEQFHYPELLKFISYHHEKTDGSGFPGGFTFSGLAHNEVMIMMCDYMVPFSEYFFQEKDGYQVVKEQFEKIKKLDDVELVPVQHYINIWEKTMNWSLSSKDVVDDEKNQDDNSQESKMEKVA